MPDFSYSILLVRVLGGTKGDERCRGEGMMAHDIIGGTTHVTFINPLLLKIADLNHDVNQSLISMSEATKAVNRLRNFYNIRNLKDYKRKIRMSRIQRKVYTDADMRKAIQEILGERK